MHRPHDPLSSPSDFLMEFWQQLKTLKYTQFQAKSYSKGKTGWNGRGEGEVDVVEEGKSTLLLHERGIWRLSHQNLAFSNTFRWTLNGSRDAIVLEHFRLGAFIFLFQLTFMDHHLYGSHRCKEDLYLAQVGLNGCGVRLYWQVTGPRKQEEIQYDYLISKSLFKIS